MEDFDIEGVRDALRALERGYIARDAAAAAPFAEALFAPGEDISIVGTSTGELAFGRAAVTELIRGDWAYWGDVRLDCGGADIAIYGNVGWFRARGGVKYSFAHTPERYQRYVDFIGGVAQDNALTSAWRVAFINWALTLTCHQRGDGLRQYWWPLTLSGAATRAADGWQIAHLHFAIDRAAYPDERFESDAGVEKSVREQSRALASHPMKMTARVAQKLQNAFVQAQKAGNLGDFSDGVALDTDSAVCYMLDGAAYCVAPGYGAQACRGRRWPPPRLKISGILPPRTRRQATSCLPCTAAPRSPSGSKPRAQASPAPCA